TRCLIAHEAVLDPDQIVRERLIVVDVAVALRKVGIPVIAHAEVPVDDAVRLGEVLAEIVKADLGRPAGQVFTVEELNPLRLVRIELRRAAPSAGGTAGEEERGGESQEGCPPGTSSVMCGDVHTIEMKG